jgi:ABC-2 type transport system permease protein/oleandomycin transport system permease protein
MNAVREVADRPSYVEGLSVNRVLWALSDGLVVAKRNLLKYVRVPTLLIFSTIQPIMFVLLFAYVFGGAITIPGVNYIDFLMAGIFTQTVTFGSTNTGVGLAEDLSKGIIDRFRSLPMARSAVLGGRTLSDAVRNFVVVLLMLAVGSLIGFRFHAGPVAAIAALLLAVLHGFAFTWISATLGLAVKDVESAQAVGFIWIFPLVFASSAFVPVESMPGWLQGFANINPITVTVNSIRALTLGGPVWIHLWKSLAWIAGILAVFVPLAVNRYRRAV